MATATEARTAYTRRRGRSSQSSSSQSFRGLRRPPLSPGAAESSRPARRSSSGESDGVEYRVAAATAELRGRRQRAPARPAADFVAHHAPDLTADRSVMTQTLCSGRESRGIPGEALSNPMSRETQITESTDFFADAACQGADTSVFFPVSDTFAGEAKAICATCPVAEACLEYAIATRQPDGVWGGLTRWSVIVWCGGVRRWLARRAAKPARRRRFTRRRLRGFLRRRPGVASAGVTAGGPGGDGPARLARVARDERRDAVHTAPRDRQRDEVADPASVTSTRPCSMFMNVG